MINDSTNTEQILTIVNEIFFLYLNVCVFLMIIMFSGVHEIKMLALSILNY